MKNLETLEIVYISYSLAFSAVSAALLENTVANKILKGLVLAAATALALTLFGKTNMPIFDISMIITGGFALIFLFAKGNSGFAITYKIACFMQFIFMMIHLAS